MHTGEGNDVVALGEVEGGEVGAEDPPFHGVFGLEPVELVAEGGAVGDLGELGRADGSADEDAGAVGEVAEGLGGGEGGEKEQGEDYVASAAGGAGPGRKKPLTAEIAEEIRGGRRKGLLTAKSAKRVRRERKEELQGGRFSEWRGMSVSQRVVVTGGCDDVGPLSTERCIAFSARSGVTENKRKVPRLRSASPHLLGMTLACWALRTRSALGLPCTKVHVRWRGVKARGLLLGAEHAVFRTCVAAAGFSRTGQVLKLLVQ